MQSTPSSERVHISIFGRCNAGKSTLVNRLTGQDVAIVSPIAGTTTDPVQKPMEINGLGAAVIIDTPGLDDNTALGGERVARSAKVLDRTDIAVVLLSEGDFQSELRLMEECRVREIPVVVALSHSDSIADLKTELKRAEEATGRSVIAISALTGEGIEELTKAIALMPFFTESKRSLPPHTVRWGATSKRAVRLRQSGICSSGSTTTISAPGRAS